MRISRFSGVVGGLVDSFMEFIGGYDGDARVGYHWTVGEVSVLLAPRPGFTDVGCGFEGIGSLGGMSTRRHTI